jgi:hypothetical protein
VGDISKNKQGLPGKIGPDLVESEAVQEGLGGMGVPSIPGIDHMAGKVLGQEMGGSAHSVPDDQEIRMHGLQGQGRILEVFPFLQAASALGQGKGVCGQPLGGHVKGGFGPGAGFGKKKNHTLSLESGGFFDRPFSHFSEPLAKLKDGMDILD